MTDLIAAARAMIEPLTGYTPKPWKSHGRYIGTPRHASYIGECRDINGNWSDRAPASDNARLIAAAPDLRDMVPTLADALEAERAKVAAAYEAAAQAVRAVLTNSPTGEWGAEGISMSRAIERAIHALTPADAQAALDKLLAEAWLEGWRAGREAAADEAQSCTHDPYVIRAIRALPEPKETNRG